MKILLLGSNGQVGSELKSALTFLTQSSDLQLELTFTDRSILDMEDIPGIFGFLNRIAPDIIVNACAYTAVDMAESQRDLAFLLNKSAVKEIAIYCKQNKRSLIHISTDYVFDGKGDNSYLETDYTNPLTVYGTSKLAGENAIREFLCEHIILRTSWVFGVKGVNFVKTMLRLAENKSELGVVVDQIGAPTSARGIAETITNIIKRILSSSKEFDHWGTYHYSGYPYISWADFANEIFKQAIQRDLIRTLPTITPISTEDYPTPAKRPPNSRLNCAKLENTFGIEPDDWKRSLGLMLDELKQEILN